MTRGLFIGLLCWGLAMAAIAQQRVVGHFSAGDLQDWETKVFTGKTMYKLTQDQGKQVLRADSRGTASGLYREININLEETPYLNWSWRVDNVLQGVDERSKAGDDFPARVYVVVSGGALFWKTRSLVYVWSSNQAPGSTWDNAYTGNAKVMALRSGAEEAGRWASEKRDIRADFKRLFGSDIDEIDAVAIMSDTDNSSQNATAWYGDIYFSRD